MFLNNFSVEWGLLYDSLSIIILWTVCLISFLVQLYATMYMSDDPHLSRFMLKLTFFSTFMFILVSANNFMQFLFGWEGVGISSYLLINFWFGRIVANRSAFQAIILNRIGDFGLMLGLIFLYLVFNTLDFDIIFNIASEFGNSSIFLFNYPLKILNLAALFLLIGVMGKSAQIGLHTWLPSAMEGPTPVSALIHSSTMVVAGVFLVIRCSKLFETCSFILIFVCFIGALTILLSSFLGIVQYDIKKIIAYSTCSQLGYMLFACGLYNYVGSAFHLVTHAFFKSLLFLCAGCIVHAFNGEQDIRFMGLLRNKLPGTYIIMFVGVLTLNGIFFTSSFYSKEILLGGAFLVNDVFGFSAFILAFLSISLTSFYSFRLIYFVFFETPQSRLSATSYETDFLTFFCIFLLFIFTIFFGFFIEDFFVGFGTLIWQNSLSLNFFKIFEVEFIDFVFQFLPFICVFWGFYLFYIFENFIKTLSFLKFFGFEVHSFGWDGLHKLVSFWAVLFYSYSVFFKILDKGIFEFLEYLSLVRLFYMFNILKNIDLTLNSLQKLLFVFFNSIISLIFLVYFIILNGFFYLLIFSFVIFLVLIFEFYNVFKL